MCPRVQCQIVARRCPIIANEAAAFEFTLVRLLLFHSRFVLKEVSPKSAFIRKHKVAASRGAWDRRRAVAANVRAEAILVLERCIARWTRKLRVLVMCAHVGVVHRFWESLVP